MFPRSWRTHWLSCAFVVVMVVVAGSGGWYALTRGPAQRAEASAPQNANDAVSVEVATPRGGGIDRICLQPGSVEPFEAADLYAKVSGFLLEQYVDIGSPVREKQVLAKIWVPEYEKQVKHDAADVARSEAKVDQMKAAITTAQADLGAAAATVGFAQADKKSKAAFRAYREKQRDRIQALVSRQALEAALQDEQEGQFQAALAAELAADQAIATAQQKKAAAQARVTQAEADLRYAEAEVTTAKARLEKSQVLLDYTIIRSPYNGVVTKRNFNRGEFIRAADSGGDRTPILAVDRTDIMRIVIQVPERDVPFVDCGDPAVVEVDALPGVVFKTTAADKVEVSCFAASEDAHTRMMRTEVHVKNSNHKLRRGMFGRVTLLLHSGTKDALRIPSAALTGKAADGKGSVRVVRDRKVYFVPIHYGADNGTEVEVLGGLNVTDHVIVRANGPVGDGDTVTITEKAARGGH